MVVVVNGMIVIVVMLSNVSLVFIVVVVLVMVLVVVKLVVEVVVGVVTKNAIVRLGASFNEVFADSGRNCDVD